MLTHINKYRFFTILKTLSTKIYQFKRVNNVDFIKLVEENYQNHSLKMLQVVMCHTKNLSDKTNINKKNHKLIDKNEHNGYNQEH